MWEERAHNSVNLSSPIPKLSVTNFDAIFIANRKDTLKLMPQEEL